MSAPRRLTWAEPVKGAAILMVAAYHVYLYLSAAGIDVAGGRAKALFELFPMPALFLVAGMAASGHSGLALSSLWWRRIWPVVYVYFLWSLLRAAFYAVVPSLQGGLGDLPAADWRTLVLLPVWPSSSYWFLYGLAVFMFVRRLIAPLPAWLQLSGAVLVSTAFSTGLITINNGGWMRIGQLFVFFVGGALLASPLKRAVDRSRAWHTAPLAIALLVLTAGLLLGLRRVPLVTLTGQVLAVSLGVVALAHLPAGRLRNAVTLWGSQSFRVYLIHIFPIVLISAVIGRVVPDWPRVLDVGVQVATTVLVLWLSLRFSVLSGRWRWLYAPPQALLPHRARNRVRGPQARP